MIINGNMLLVGNNQGIKQGVSQTYNLSIPPNYGVGGMPTKSAPKMSDEEFRTAIEELAKRDAAAGRFQLRNNPEFGELLRSYVYVASPDRQGNYRQFAFKLRRKAKSSNANAQF